VLLNFIDSDWVVSEKLINLVKVLAQMFPILLIPVSPEKFPPNPTPGIPPRGGAVPPDCRVGRVIRDDRYQGSVAQM
jgi:hypothetical protein